MESLQLNVNNGDLPAGTCRDTQLATLQVSPPRFVLEVHFLEGCSSTPDVNGAIIDRTSLILTLRAGLYRPSRYLTVAPLSHNNKKNRLVNCG